VSGRIQSPSSINTYSQCPRKYYYAYIAKLPTKPSIHLVRGLVVHETLEAFFGRPLMTVSEDTKTDLLHHVLSIAKERWVEHADDLATLGLTAAELTSYREETTMMLINWVNHFWETLRAEMTRGLSFTDAFARHTPRIEEEYLDAELKVRGYIDTIHERDGEVHIRDYKTSKKPVITDEYRLQLAIYARLYERTHGVLPDTVGIFFLKFGEQLLQVNDELLKEADTAIRWVHERTQTSDMGDYPKRLSPLCNYCDFYERCWKQKTVEEFSVRE
jgi:RecB family exonuclease